MSYSSWHHDQIMFLPFIHFFFSIYSWLCYLCGNICVIKTKHVLPTCSFIFTALEKLHSSCSAPMMTSSNGNIFHVTGHLCVEFTGPRWIPHTKASDAELWCFLWSAPGINSWVNNGEAGDLRRHHAHYDVIVMQAIFPVPFKQIDMSARHVLLHNYHCSSIIW